MTHPLRLPSFSFTKTTLANGLDVILRREVGLPIVAVNLWYHVGSRNEERRQRGFAHLFEHLMFEGSEHFPGDFFKPLQRLGASVNGSTSADRTNYHVDIPSAHLELALAMESDRMACLLPALDERKLRVQKDVVKNEFRQNYANRPYGRVPQILAEALYPPDHPYSWLTIGVMEEVEAATRDDVAAFFRRYYVPANASLCLAGDIDEDDALHLAERYFEGIPGGAPAVPTAAPEFALASTRSLRLHDQVELARVHAAWPTTPHFHPDEAPLALLADILARGRSSRLFRALVIERQVAQDVSAHQSSREIAGSFGSQITLRPGQAPGLASETLDAEIHAIATNGVTLEELERVKNLRLADGFRALESLGGFGGVADRLNAYNVYLGDPGRITSDLDRFQAVTPDDVQKAARVYLDGRARVHLVVEKGTPRVTAAPLDRNQRPESKPAAPFRAPTPVVSKLGAGLPLWVIPSRSLPVVAGVIVLGPGAGAQGPGQAGLAHLSAALLDEGTARRTSVRIAEETERMGSALWTSCGWDGSYVSFRCLGPHLDATLDLATDVALRPSFPDHECARLQGQTLAALRSERDSAEARATRALLAEIYPQGHPYRVPLLGDPESVSRFTRADMETFHATRLGPPLASCVIAGDVEPDDLARRLDPLLMGWPGERPHVSELATPRRAERPRIVLLDRPGSVQAAVRVGYAGIRRLDPDHTDLLLLEHVLGGQFTSRLNSKLREEKGFTYGIRSHWDARTNAGPFMIAASLQADRLAEALEDLRAEVLALLEDRPVTQDELDDARRSLVEGQCRHFETPADLVSRYAGLFVHGLPPDHHGSFADRLAGVSLDSLRAAADRQIHVNSLVFVIVADAASTLDSLRRLEWAQVEARVE